MRKTIRFVTVIGLIIAIFSIGAVATATPSSTYSLSSLIAGDSITIGDKTFADWGTSGPIDPAAVTVIPTLIGGVYAIDLQGPFTSSDGALTEIGLFYSVAASASKITSIDQSFNLTATGAGGIVGIKEKIWDAGFDAGNRVAISIVAYSHGITDPIDPPGEELTEGDVLVINPGLSKIWVKTDVYALSDPLSVVGASIIHQSFHQDIGTPDGGSTLLFLGSALTTIGFISRRIRK